MYSTGELGCHAYTTFSSLSSYYLKPRQLHVEAVKVTLRGSCFAVDTCVQLHLYSRTTVLKFCATMSVSTSTRSWFLWASGVWLQAVFAEMKVLPRRWR